MGEGPQEEQRAREKGDGPREDGEEQQQHEVAEQGFGDEEEMLVDVESS